ncbi:TIGR02117 family protein [Sandaracinobacteroides saxicola]|uniref:TIGR02117 family protein n=1 Tax=Sandaracinobacteroides saxicola TaxID=2759707 RepID=A0A7G5IGW1_9SPHN|nr:TIGR02117 family protein [Sandaracinobacteroides saxicola]QMW22603.1 TIGR02117 family protein [Sandaracinobacteroides saxicola]
MRLLRALAAACALLLLALVGGAVIPQNAGWRQAPAGVTVHLASNGVHAYLVLPLVTAGADWRALVRDGHFRGAPAGQQWLAFGWGERDFYLNTPTWADARVDRILSAALGSDRTLVHVDRLAAPEGVPIRLSPAQYAVLVDVLAASFARGSAGDVQPLPGAGYGADDAFYVARGRYSALRTCNQWVRDALASAGVRVGLWTPLEPGLMWRFR